METREMVKEVAAGPGWTTEAQLDLVCWFIDAQPDRFHVMLRQHLEAMAAEEMSRSGSEEKTENAKND